MYTTFDIFNLLIKYSKLPLNYTLIRSKRRTLSIQISSHGELIARAPMRMSIHFIEDFIEQKKDWIIKHQTKIANSAQNTVHPKEYSKKETDDMKQKLRKYIIPRVQELWEGKGLPKYTTIKITKSERRWGSCSAKNSLCFSYRLGEYLETNIDIDKVHRKDYLFVPETKKSDTNLGLCTMPLHSPFIDAIIVHELAHLREKNHQKPFWNLVYSMMPNYKDIIHRHSAYRGIS